MLQVLLLFFLVLPSLNQVHGQEPIPRAEPAISGSVVIVVSDFSGAVVPNANVTVTNRSTGITLTAQTDTKGRVKIPSLPPGDYEVTTTYAGFAAARTRFSHQVGAAQTVSVVLGGPLPKVEPDTQHSAPSSGRPERPLQPESRSPESQVPSLTAEEKKFGNENEVQQYLNEQLQSKHLVISVIPLGNRRSIFVLRTDDRAVTYTALLVPKPIGPTDLANRLGQHEGNFLVGVHRLTGSSYVLVLMRSNE